MLVDSNTGKTVNKLSGHLYFSFASAWQLETKKKRGGMKTKKKKKKKKNGFLFRIFFFLLKVWRNGRPSKCKGWRPSKCNGRASIMFCKFFCYILFMDGRSL
ncbi:hypothetical protein Pint_13182 [Pistacia integerrima]|uniref:Uncharacterized protein n=1 Tax=Pistacia integerrima TaxID=434235 RepID=A0ACC0Y9H6_9ROSI|nr:hypothetical protein Pint_13182 [Pistacia integerrima]